MANVNIKVLERGYGSVSLYVYTQDSASWYFYDCRIRAKPNSGGDWGSWQYFNTGNSSWGIAPCWVTGLSAFTTYNFQVQVRWSDSGDWSGSYETTDRTLGAATINTLPDVQPDAGIPLTATVSCNIYSTNSNLNYKLRLVCNRFDETSTGTVKANSTGVQNLMFAFSQSAVNTLCANAFGSATTKNTITAYLITYYGASTQIDSQSVKIGKVILTEQNSHPTISGFTFQDTNSGVTAVTGSDQIMLQTFSNLRVVVGQVRAKHGAYLAKYEVTVGRVTKAVTVSKESIASKTIDFGSIAVYGNSTAITVKVTDSRGFKYSVTNNAKVIKYERPKFSRYIVNREDEVEETLNFDLAGSISSIKPSSEEVNSLQLATISYKRSSDTTWTTLPILSRLTISGMNFSYAVNELLDDQNQAIRFEENSSYDFRITLRDVLGTMTEYVKDVLIPAATGAVTILARTTQYPFPRTGINQAKPTEALDVVGNIKLSGVIKTPTGQVMSFVENAGESSLSAAAYKKTGLYYIPYASGSYEPSGIPENSPGFLEVYATANGYVLQRFTALNTANVYTRTYGSSWSNWKQL